MLCLHSCVLCRELLVFSWSNREFISVFLMLADAWRVPDRWHRGGSFKLMLVNQQFPACSITRGEFLQFLYTAGQSLLTPAAVILVHCGTSGADFGSRQSANMPFVQLQVATWAPA